MFENPAWALRAVPPLHIATRVLKVALMPGRTWTPKSHHLLQGQEVDSLPAAAGGELHLRARADSER
jgi:hypothetical protein